MQSKEVSNADARIYDYVKACNPDMPPIPPLSHLPELHETGTLIYIYIHN